MNILHKAIESRTDIPSDNIHVFVEPQRHGNVWDCNYYLANNAPTYRWIFWLHPYDLTPLHFLDTGPVTPATIGERHVLITTIIFSLQAS